MRVAVCVLTYQRPEGLKRLIDGLNQLTFQKCEPPQVEIIVVDNDSTGSNYEWCQQISSTLKWTLKYYIEPQRGISYARNKAVNSAGDVDFIAFIDDDEVPEKCWLDELLYVQGLYNADVVSGPVIPYFTENIPTWVTKGKFYERLRYPTGSSLNCAATNNVLIRTEIFRKFNTMFHERFALTGGEDTHFFMRVYRAGYKIVQANDALVYEWIPKSRVNAKWILQRAYSTGSSFTSSELELYPSISVLFMRVVRAARWIVQGMVLILPSLFKGRHVFIKALQYVYRGVGMLACIAGKRYEEYRTTHQV